MYKVILSVSVIAVLSAGISLYVERERHDSIWWENEVERTSLIHEIQVARFRLINLDKGFDPALLEAANAKKEILHRRVDGLTQQSHDLVTSLEQGKAEFVKYREDRMQALRTRALGKDWKEFVPDGGKSFVDARIVSIDDSGVTLRHRDGSARVHFRELTEAQRHAFGLDEAGAATADAGERQRSQAYDSWLQDEVKSAESKKTYAVRTFVPVEPARADDNPVIAANMPARQSPLSEPARRVGTGTRYYRSGTSIYYYSTLPYCSPAYGGVIPGSVPTRSGRMYTPGSSQPLGPFRAPTTPAGSIQGPVGPQISAPLPSTP